MRGLFKLISNATDWKVAVAKHETLVKAAKPARKTTTGCSALWNKMKVNGRKKGKYNRFKKQEGKTGNNKFCGGV